MTWRAWSLSPKGTRGRRYTPAEVCPRQPLESRGRPAQSQIPARRSLSKPRSVARNMSVTDPTDLKRRRIAVGLGWGRPKVAAAFSPLGHPSVVILSALGVDPVSPVCARVRRRLGIIAVRSAQYSSGGSAPGAGTPPVDMHKLGNSSALPGVVT